MLTLVIGNKSYSSWSLRPWLLMTEAGIPFEEIRLSLSGQTFHQHIGKYSAAGRVPVLIDPGHESGELRVWDSLAIAEYLAERFPDRGLWPAASAERAHARSLCAEMHTSFGRLRQAWPMNVSARLPGCGWSTGVQDDVDRLVGIWRECLAASGGPMLFGKFSIVDAFFAPVVFRFATYEAELPADIAAYRDRIRALPGMQAWAEAARAEDEFLIEDEPYVAIADGLPSACS